MGVSTTSHAVIEMNLRLYGSIQERLLENGRYFVLHCAALRAIPTRQP
jgi:hypothetical protein